MKKKLIKEDGMINKFKQFISRGNVLDMAVGVIVGGAFGKIVTSFVNDIIMPLIGMIVKGQEFSALKVVLSSAQPEVTDASGAVIIPAVEEVALRYGAFIQNIVDFLIISVCIFLFVQLVEKLRTSMEKLKKKEEEPAEEAPAEPPAPTEAELLAEIRDLLKAKQE